MLHYISQEMATLLAILLGPVLAVWASRFFDNRREKRVRRWDIFCDLMRRRNRPLTYVVGPLNLIHAEFHDKKNVIDAWERLHNHLGEFERNENNRKQFDRKKDRLFAELLQEMAKSLGIQLDSRIIDDTIYSPIGWRKGRMMKSRINKHLMKVLSGEAPIMIQKVKKVSDSSHQSNPSKEDTN